MNVPFFIAKRFFYTKRKNHFVNIISLVSLVGVCVGTSALILVLSVFNGFEDLVLSMYNSFDPDIKITCKKDKTFNYTKFNEKISSLNEIESMVLVLEENVLLKYNNQEFIATIKGVSKNYHEIINVESILIDGDYINNYKNNNVAVIGSGIAYYLSMGLGGVFDQLQIFLPNRNATTLLNPQTAFKKSLLLPVGVFRIQAEIDKKYIITPIEFIQELAEKRNEVSSIEIKISDLKKSKEVKKELHNILGNDYIIRNRIEQKEILYKILNNEKIAVFLILVFIILIATFNVIGSLSVLILDKKKDIISLKNIGASKKEIEKIFFNTNMLNVLFGVFLGISIGVCLSLIQKEFGLVSMGEGNFIVSSYPVSLSLKDIVVVVFTVNVIGLIASWYTSKVLTGKLFRN